MDLDSRQGISLLCFPGAWDAHRMGTFLWFYLHILGTEKGSHELGPLRPWREGELRFIHHRNVMSGYAGLVLGFWKVNV